VAVTGIQFDPAWVGGYATLAANSAEALAEGVKTMGTAPLDQESFGQLGRTIHTTQAYGSASQLLREQLGRAVAALNAAAEGLDKITETYVEGDADAMVALKKELP
jgi:hypothetical protein